MTALLAVDPSLTSSGAALFRGGVLVDVAHCVVDSTEDNYAARANRMGLEIVNWVAGACRNWDRPPTTFAVEWPRSYPGARQAAPIDKVIPCAAVAGSVAGMLTAALIPLHETLEVLAFTPAEWAGQVPKSRKGDGRDSKRGQRIARTLFPDEKVAWVKKETRSHDVVDAIGIGLHALGRGYL